MNTKEIENILNYKMDTLLDGISEICRTNLVSGDFFVENSTSSQEAFFKDLKKNIIISGGCIPSLYLDEDVNDYDIYITDKEVLNKLITLLIEIWNKFKYAVKLTDVPQLEVINNKDSNDIKIVKSGETSTSEIYSNNSSVDGLVNNVKSIEETTFFNEDKKDSPEWINQESYIGKTKKNIEKINKFSNIESIQGIIPTYISPRAIMLNNDMHIIIHSYKNIEEIHKNFDFEHCKNYWKYQDKKLYINLESIEAILNKQLKYTNSLYSLSSLLRAFKFVKRGWSIQPSDILKILFQIRELELSSVDDLKNHLGAMDIIYVNRLVKKIKNVSISGINVISAINELENE